MNRCTLCMLLATTSCTSGGESPFGPAVELGTGELAFVPLADGDELDVIFGPQGGYHVLGSVRTLDIEPGDTEDLANPRNPEVVFSLRVNGEPLEIVGSYTQGLRPSDQPPWSHQMLNRFIILDIDDDDDIVGQTAEFTVSLTDVRDVIFEDRREVLLVKHPAND